MKNLFSSKKFLVLVMVLVMVASTTFSFAYWLHGLHGNKTDQGLDISVGSGNTIDTRVVAVWNNSLAQNDTKKLIPYTKASLIAPQAGTYGADPEPNFLYDGDKYTTQIQFGYDVTWTHDYNTDYYDSTVAELRIRYTIHIDDVDYTNVKGKTDRNLFEITSTDINEIELDKTEVIIFTLTMDEPKDEAQYNEVTGLQNGLKIVVYFDVITSDDKAA